jgi:hypothetical protein
MTPRSTVLFGRILSALAVLFVLVALVIPNQLSSLTPVAFLRVPVEALLLVLLLLLLPARYRPWVALGAGGVLGLLLVLKIVDMGFRTTLDRPFDPALDWTFFGPAVNFLIGSVGRFVAILAVVVAVVLVLAVPLLMALAVRRLTPLLVAHRPLALRVVAALGAAWVVCALVGVQLVPGVPVADRNTVGLALSHLRQVGTDIVDQREYDRSAAVDAFRDVRGSDLLSRLKGKDVILVMVESYGRVALEDPVVSSHVQPVLASEQAALAQAGFGARSAFLTSSTAGGGSWLAHSTLQSGLWISNQQRYRDLVGSDRVTLTGAFRTAGWRTVNVAPGNREPWPDAGFFGFDHTVDAFSIGYKGPTFNFSSVPDQFTLSSFQHSELAPSPRLPVMAEVDLLSSHAPWEPVPEWLDWNAIGDGTGYRTPTNAGDPAEIVLQRDRTVVLNDYGNAIAYSLRSLLSFVETYGTSDTVVIFLGDHQPAPVVAGEGATRDVPISIVARDPAVLSDVAGWGWEDGLRPSPRAPVARMDTFRDRFLSTFSSP